MSIIVKSVVIHDHAYEDLKLLRASNIKAAATIAVLLQELKVDPKTTIEVLTTRGNIELNDFNLSVNDWKRVSRLGNLWRLRILNTPATTFRIIYGYHWLTNQLCVFAIVNKENYNYDDLTTEINKRIITDWNSI